MLSTQWWLVISSPEADTKLPEQPGSCTALASRPPPAFASHSRSSGSAEALGLHPLRPLLQHLLRRPLALARVRRSGEQERHERTHHR